MQQNTEGEDHGFEPFFDRIDVIVMGSGSYKTVLESEPWPYQKPVVVMSRSLSVEDRPARLADKVMFTKLSPPDLMDSLEKQGNKHVYVDGGAVVQAFLKQGLIASMKVTIVPIMIGDGIRLFGALPADVDLTLAKVTQHPSGLVDLDYTLP